MEYPCMHGHARALIAPRYALNIGFNLLNKSIFKYFPFPWTVSTVHVIVGLVYCVLMYVIGFKDASFGRVSSEQLQGHGSSRAAHQKILFMQLWRIRFHLFASTHGILHAPPHPPMPHPLGPSPQIITKKEFGNIFGPASMHAIGHVAANLSFAAVAISLTHTVKTLEPAFNVVLAKLILGEATPLPAVLSLIPIMVRVPGHKATGLDIRGRSACAVMRLVGCLWRDASVALILGGERHALCTRSPAAESSGIAHCSSPCCVPQCPMCLLPFPAPSACLAAPPASNPSPHPDPPFTSLYPSGGCGSGLCR